MPIEEVPTLERVSVKPKGTETSPDASSTGSANVREHGTPEIVGAGDDGDLAAGRLEVEERKKGRFSYLRTKDFWIVLALRSVFTIRLKNA